MSLDLAEIEYYAAESDFALRSPEHGSPAAHRASAAHVKPLLAEVRRLTAEAEGLRRVIDDQRARIIAQAGVIDLMRPVVEHVSMGRKYVGVGGPYPDGTARRALGALDDLDGGSPTPPTRPATGRCGICLKGVHKPVGEDWSHYAMPVPYHQIDGVTVNARGDLATETGPTGLVPDETTGNVTVGGA